MVWRMLIVAKLYPGYSVCQTIPQVQSGYNLCTPDHTLDNVNIGYGLAVFSLFSNKLTMEKAQNLALLIYVDDK